MIRVLRWFRPTIAGVWYSVVVVAAIVGYTLAADYPVPWRDLLAPARLATIIGAGFACLALGRALARTRAPRPAILELLVAPFLVAVPAVVVGALTSFAANGYFFTRPGVDSRLSEVARVSTATQFGQRGRDGAMECGPPSWPNGYSYDVPSRRVLVALHLRPGEGPLLPFMAPDGAGRVVAAAEASGQMMRLKDPELKWLDGYIVEATLRDGTPIVVAAICGGEVVNDRRSYQEFVFARDAVGNPGRLLSVARFPFDTDMNLSDWPLWAAAVGLWLLPVPLMVAEDRARRRKREERATAVLPSPAG